MRAFLFHLTATLVLATACGRDKLVDHGSAGAAGGGGSGGSGGAPHAPRCGDGVRDPNEACDGTDLGGASCAGEGFAGGELTCSVTCQLVMERCYHAERCDNGVDDDRDGAVDCEDADCIGRAPCPRCGDGVANRDEACDGADLRDGSCTSLGYDGGDLACRANCTFETSACFRTEKCGNGVDDDGDGVIDCDDQDCLGVAPCPRCGDGVRNLDEECDAQDLAGSACTDLGYDDGILGCSPACTFDTSRCHHFEDCTNGLDDDGDGLVDCADIDCTTAFECPSCGNEIVQAGEDCDGAIQVTCQDHGFDTGVLTCSPTCTWDTTGCRDFTCGDGRVEGDERCDDGNLAVGDGCTPDCHIEGDVCEAPATLAWDPAESVWRWSGDLATLFPDYESVCHSTDRMADAVASFTAPAAGRYYATADAAFDVVLSAWSGTCGIGAPQAACADRREAGQAETIEFDLQAGETVYVVVAESEPAAGSPSNAGPFMLTVGAAVCGDGALQGLEQCEDGNLVPGDGCDANCRFEGDTCVDAFPLNSAGFLASWADTDFVEPYELPTSRPPWLWVGSTEQFSDEMSACNSLMTGRDGLARFIAPTPGLYSVKLYSTFRSIVFGRTGAGAPCGSQATDCSGGSTLPSAGVIQHGGELSWYAWNPGDTLMIQVEGWPNALVPDPNGPFYLRVYAPGVCGDGIGSYDEECDDGNTVPGDGCDEYCQAEGRDIEPNDSISTASPLGPGLGVGTVELDDFWSFDVVEGRTYRIRTADTRTLDGDCSLGRLDTTLRLYDASGTLLAENDDAPDAAPCSRIDWTATSTGTIFIRVSLSSYSEPTIGPYVYRPMGSLPVGEFRAYQLTAVPIP